MKTTEQIISVLTTHFSNEEQQALLNLLQALAINKNRPQPNPTKAIGLKKESKTTIIVDDPHTPHQIKHSPTLPEYVPAESWQDYCDFRKKKSGKGWTQKAHDINLKTLIKLCNDGGDAVAIIEQTIANNWSGLFAVKEQSKGRGSLVNYKGMNLSRAGAETVKAAEDWLNEVDEKKND